MNPVDALRQSGLLRPGQRVLCALSGGADSVCMTHALCALRQAYSLTVAAAHFTHGLRPEQAEAERALCQSLCDGLGIPLFCGEGDTAAYAAKKSLGTEEAARTLRYAFLDRAADIWRADSVATAHNLEDNAETVLLHLIRGSGRAGWEGIPPQRGRYIRPMLAVSRREIEEYNAARGLAFAVDESNFGTDNARALLRNRVFPLLREVNPRAAEHMAAAAALLRREGRSAQRESEAFLASVRRTEEGALFSAEALLALSKEAAARALQALQREQGGQMLTRAQFEALFALCHKPDPSAQVCLTGSRALRRYEDVLLTRRHPQASPEPLLLTDFGTAVFGSWNIEIAPGTGKREAMFPITVRSRRAGDEICLPAGRRSVKKLMIDRKIPKDLRDTVPIVCHNNKILTVGDVCAAALRGENAPVRVICRRKEI
ncbi:MAG: tRNA lysidine(34) synthetase TilS [Clostridia bacterium]|nr:tRNA lysidine(34) synthetase TilS [Clostridia bacterium]